ncbi:hypothetical protein SAMN04487939_106150 [Lysobacter sp. yr284]|uniref:hypothetical protein n=1 Tax=Lysobacter sp. yr284 TaxID=1761791 RepID=UPI00089D7679|nr:hypothetical protein [Lysobacter sp. yr284]SDY80087.1 hypothetical protein SAMN04487939_106150 [Lysobacter sp. yr284]
MKLKPSATPLLATLALLAAWLPAAAGTVTVSPSGPTSLSGEATVTVLGLDGRLERQVRCALDLRIALAASGTFTVAAMLFSPQCYDQTGTPFAVAAENLSQWRGTTSAYDARSAQSGVTNPQITLIEDSGLGPPYYADCRGPSLKGLYWVGVADGPPTPATRLYTPGNQSIGATSNGRKCHISLDLRPSPFRNFRYAP